jgi:hypothetical protein
MNQGIIVRIDWNDNRWEKPSNSLDNASNYGYVRENNISHTSFNFAHEIFEPESDGLWYGLIPAFYSRNPDKDKISKLRVVFLISNNQGKDYLIGIYAFPIIKNKKREKIIPNYPDIDLINIGSEVKNILRLDNYVDFNLLNQKKALGNQQIALRGWNYVKKENVGYIFDFIQEKNPNNDKLKQIKYRCLK